MKANQILLVSSLIALASCQPQRPEQTKAIAQSQLENESSNVYFPQELNTNDFEINLSRKLSIEEGQSASDYAHFANKFKITAKSGVALSSTTSLTLRCVDDSDKGQLPTTYSKKFLNSESVDIFFDLENSKFYEHHIACTLMNNDEMIKTVEFSLKKDLVINKAQTYNDLGLVAGMNNLGALIITSSGKLITNGAKLTLKTTDLVIDEQGSIDTFSEDNLNSLENENGIDGGKITIIAENALGNLNVNLRGKNGGPRSTIPKEITNTPSQKTLDGGRNFNCRGTNLNGNPGEQGAEGFPGTSGGATGDFEITIANNQHRMNIKNSLIHFQAGLGSIGGIGGKGGPGAGRTIVNYWYDNGESRGYRTQCSTGNAGAQGPQGTQGKHGENGAIGIFKIN